MLLLLLYYPVLLTFAHVQEHPNCLSSCRTVCRLTISVLFLAAFFVAPLVVVDSIVPLINVHATFGAPSLDTDIDLGQLANGETPPQCAVSYRGGAVFGSCSTIRRTRFSRTDGNSLVGDDLDTDV